MHTAPTLTNLAPLLLSALLGTILIELGVLWLLRERRRRVLVVSVVANVLTNVSLNVWLLAADAGWRGVAVGEVAVVAVEALCYFAVMRQMVRSLVYSVLCNAISYLSGLLFMLLALCV